MEGSSTPSFALRFIYARVPVVAQLNLLNHPICLAYPRRFTPFSAWHEHIPFAMFLVDLLKPKVIVELGTHYGDSYCTFCQAVQELRLETRCYAVDTWKGDSQTGFYGPEVLADLRAHHDPLYGSYSRLIQSTFDEARPHFKPGTIDLLHIDGYHTYDQVQHDFDNWVPFLSPQGMILLHDINVMEHDFGIRRFWDEIKARYPHFEFVHGHGLGVLSVGRNQPPAIREFLEASEKDTDALRNLFFELGHRLTLDRQHTEALNERERFQSEMQNSQKALAQKEREASQLLEAWQGCQRALANKEAEAINLQATLRNQMQILEGIYATRGWKLLQRFRCIMRGPRKSEDGC